MHDYVLSIQKISERHIVANCPGSSRTAPDLIALSWLKSGLSWKSKFISSTQIIIIIIIVFFNNVVMHDYTKVIV